jgi:hypothetical protein
MANRKKAPENIQPVDFSAFFNFIANRGCLNAMEDGGLRTSLCKGFGYGFVL